MSGRESGWLWGWDLRRRWTGGGGGDGGSQVDGSERKERRVEEQRFRCSVVHRHLTGQARLMPTSTSSDLGGLQLQASHVRKRTRSRILHP